MLYRWMCSVHMFAVSAKGLLHIEPSVTASQSYFVYVYIRGLTVEASDDMHRIGDHPY